MTSELHRSSFPSRRETAGDRRARQVVHAITPGDHFSPRTGSAIPTVVDGLAAAAERSGWNRHHVLVAQGTYPDRYTSADAIEFAPANGPSRTGHYLELVAASLGRPRFRSRRRIAAMLVDQAAWEPSLLLAHNLTEAVPLVDTRRHRVVLYAHNELLRTYSRREATRTFGSASAIVCVSQFLADRTADRLRGELAERVCAVPNGVDCALFHPSAAPSDHPELRLVFVGRVIRDKGVDVLIEALRRLGRRTITLTVIGSAGFAAGASLTRYERGLRTKAARCRSTVSFMPFVERPVLAAHIREHDVLVVPSRWPEPWGLTASEGQASGLAVVASTVGGLPETVANSDLLVPPDDPDALAAMIDHLDRDRERLRRAAAVARAHAENHDWTMSWVVLSRLLNDIEVSA